MIRRQKLETVVATQTANLLHLLEQVDTRWNGSRPRKLRVCEHCGRYVEPERLFCRSLTLLAGLSKPAEQRRWSRTAVGDKKYSRAAAQTRNSPLPDGKSLITMSLQGRSAAIIVTWCSTAKIFIQWWETFP